MKSRIVYKFHVLFLCLGCHHRWFEYLFKNENLTERECTKCGMKRSFPSFIPTNYIDEIKLEET